MTTAQAPAAPPVDARRAASGGRVLIVAVLGVLSVAVAILSVSVGAVTLSLGDIIAGLRGEVNSFIIQRYRIPRVAVSILAGAALAVSGVFLQAAVRNPLASPDVIGITKGAGLGAMVVTILLPPAAQRWAVPVGVLLGAALVTVVILSVARFVGGQGATLALVGVAIAALAAAALQYLMVVYPQNADQAMVWLAGSVYGSRPADIVLLTGWLLICLPGVILSARRLDLAGLGDDSLRSLGPSPAGTRTLLVTVAVLLACGAVAVVGGIGFLGLLAPHLARLLVGFRARWFVPVSALIGALMLSLADLFGRTIALPNEIPAGIVAAVVGGPYLLFLLLREARNRGH